ncbi:MAG: hypothetical protein V7708_11280 [Oceanicoccus sp.]
MKLPHFLFIFSALTPTVATAGDKGEPLIPGAVKKFGVMPKLNYDAKDVRTIAEYWYDGDISCAGKTR